MKLQIDAKTGVQSDEHNWMLRTLSGVDKSGRESWATHGYFETAEGLLAWCCKEPRSNGWGGRGMSLHDAAPLVALAEAESRGIALIKGACMQLPPMPVGTTVRIGDYGTITKVSGSTKLEVPWRKRWAYYFTSVEHAASELYSYWLKHDDSSDQAACMASAHRMADELCALIRSIDVKSLSNLQTGVSELEEAIA